MMMHRFTAPDDNFIITSPTFPIIEQSTLPPFLRLMDDCGHHDKKNNCFYMTGGGTCWFRTGKDPDSIVGIPKVRAILGDEAGKYSLYFWENIQGRSDSLAAPIMLVTSPYTLNWLYKEIILPKKKDPRARPDVKLVQAASVENPYFNRERYYARQLTMDPRRFKMMYGGAWDRPAGLVYDCFDDELNVCDPLEFPAGTKFFGGIDWGYTEHFAFTIRAVTPSGQHYGISETYKTNLEMGAVAAAVVAKCEVHKPVDVIYADPSQPGAIAFVNRALKTAGLKTSVVPANNSKRLGLDAHYSLLKTRRLKYFKGQMRWTLDELDSYHYPEPEDLNPDDRAKEALPVEQKDHLMDAERYVSLATLTFHERRAPSVPSEEKPKQESPHQHIERLKRKPRVNGAEEWSA